jgi:hypothetical protein
MDDLSARARSFSAKSKPSVAPNRSARGLAQRTWFNGVNCSNGTHKEVAVEARLEQRTSLGMQQDKPRLFAGGEAEALCAATCETDGLPFAVPVTGPPVGEEVVAPLRASRRALAPKLTRRVKGEVGRLGDMEAVEAGPPGSSSKGDSSTEAEFALETLSARARMFENGEGWAPGMEERPRVVMDRRLGGCWTLEAARGPKRSTKEDLRVLAGGESREFGGSEAMFGG